MRWQKPDELDVRYRTFFALFPVTIGKETRWLEMVRVREVYKFFRYYGYFAWDMTNFEPLDSNEHVHKK